MIDGTIFIAIATGEDKAGGSSLYGAQSCKEIASILLAIANKIEASEEATKDTGEHYHPLHYLTSSKQYGYRGLPIAKVWMEEA